MTLVDIKNALITHFISASTFNIDEDLRQFRVDPKEVGEDFVDNLKGITVLALEDLARLGVVSKVKEGFYILSQPITSLTQTVVVSPYTAILLADIVNGWMAKTGETKETGYTVNKLAVNDRDINSLCQICGMLLSHNDEPFDDEEDGDGTDEGGEDQPPQGRARG